MPLSPNKQINRFFRLFGGCQRTRIPETVPRIIPEYDARLLETATASPMPRRRLRQCGFTLIELLVVMGIIGIIMAIAGPIYQKSIIRAKESVLQSNLAALRSAIDMYTLNKLEAPSSLQDLLAEQYLHELPQDPMTGQSNTWKLIIEGPAVGATGGISDVRSGSDKISLSGNSYSNW
jgi:general secretion pathway protein G